MRDLNRIDRIVDKLREVWKRSPDQRLGQLVMNAVAYSEEKRVYDIFDIEDDETEHGLDIMLDLLKGRPAE
jgi:hypothetical protein